MVVPFVRVLVALSLTVPLAGCVSDAPPEGEVNLISSDDNETGMKLPDGRDFAAAEETNKTEKGVGGRVHKHDYWGGADRVVVYDDTASIGLAPVFPSRTDTSRVGVAYIDLGNVPGEDRPALVFEGTGLVEFTITKAPAWMTSARLSFRTAAQDWTDPTAIAVGETFTYEPTAVDNDVPHSVRSLWNWQITADGPLPVLADGFIIPDNGVQVTITVVKSGEVMEWPGHPAFYEETDRRVVLDNAVGKTNVQSAADVFVYGIETDALVPEKLIGVGTGSLDVFVNVTRLDSAIPPDGFTLWWYSADSRSGAHISNVANETDGKTTAHWRVAINETMVDAFYQPSSRFTFKVLANAANSLLFTCYRCNPYTLEYTMTIIANKDPNYVPPVDEASMGEG